MLEPGLLLSTWYRLKNHLTLSKYLQIESSLCRGAEVGALDSTNDVRISVDKFHEFLQAPKTAFAHAQETSCQIIGVHFQLALDVRQDGTSKLNDGDD